VNLASPTIPATGTIPDDELGDDEEASRQPAETNSARQRFDKALEQMPMAGVGQGFNDKALPRAVGLAKAAKIPAAEAIRLIHETQARATRDTGPEIRSTVERLYADDGGPRPAGKTVSFPPLERDLVDKVIDQVDLDLAEFARRSPIQGLDAIKPKDFLDQLFPGEPLITVGRKRTFYDGGQQKEVIPCKPLLLNEANALAINGAEYVVPSLQFAAWAGGPTARLHSTRQPIMALATTWSWNPTASKKTNGPRCCGTYRSSHRW